MPCTLLPQNPIADRGCGGTDCLSSSKWVGVWAGRWHVSSWRWAPGTARQWAEPLSPPGSPQAPKEGVLLPSGSSQSSKSSYALLVLRQKGRERTKGQRGTDFRLSLASLWVFPVCWKVFWGLQMSLQCSLCSRQPRALGRRKWLWTSQCKAHLCWNGLPLPQDQKAFCHRPLSKGKHPLKLWLLKGCRQPLCLAESWLSRSQQHL